MSYRAKKTTFPYVAMKRTKGSGHPHIIGASKTKTDLFTGLDITKGHADEVWHVNKTWKKKK